VGFVVSFGNLALIHYRRRGGARDGKYRSCTIRTLSPTASSASALVGAASGSASAGLFAVGQTVILGGLESRPELTGSVSILSYDSVVGR